MTEQTNNIVELIEKKANLAAAREMMDTARQIAERRNRYRRERDKGNDNKLAVVLKRLQYGQHRVTHIGRVGECRFGSNVALRAQKGAKINGK